MSADLILGEVHRRLPRGAERYASARRRRAAAVTKAILFPVRFMYTLGPGASGSTTARPAGTPPRSLPGSALALKALEWRNDGVGDAELQPRCSTRELAILHAECLTEYAKDLEASGRRSCRRAGGAERLRPVAVPGRALNHVPAAHLS